MLKRNEFKDLKIIKDIHSVISIPHLILPSHIILTLYFIYYNESASRYSISEFLAIPMTRTRKILNILEEFKLVIKFKGRKGTKLSEQGTNLCESLSKFFKIINLFESIDLGDLVLGKVNCLSAVPLNPISQTINVIGLRDTSLKCGALGASIFEISLEEGNKIKARFIDDTLENEKLNLPNNQMIRSKIFFNSIQEEKWILIASTINDLPKYYFNPIFDSNQVNPFVITLVASVQTTWELVEQEI